MSVPRSTAMLLPGQRSPRSGSCLTTASASCKHVLCALALGESVKVGGAKGGREGERGTNLTVKHEP